ncbi:hypothetical protein FHS45_001694 [Thalassobacillus devorans]|nr:hypothetical protein [Thalassobacillus devorans]
MVYYFVENTKFVADEQMLTVKPAETVKKEFSDIQGGV